MLADTHGPGIHERCSTGHHGVTRFLQGLDPALLVAAKRVLPAPGLRQLDRRLGEIDASLRGVTSHVVHQLGRDDVGLRGAAGDVGAGAAPEPVLDQRDACAVFLRRLSCTGSCR